MVLLFFSEGSVVFVVFGFDSFGGSDGLVVLLVLLV